MLQSSEGMKKGLHLLGEFVNDYFGMELFIAKTYLV